MNYLLALVSLVIAYAPNSIGVILPPLIEVLNKDVPNPKSKFIISIVVCFMVAVLFDWNKIILGTPDQAFTSMGIIFLESQAVHKLYFRTSWLQDIIVNGLPQKTVTDSAGERTLGE